jgi:integrase
MAHDSIECSCSPLESGAGVFSSRGARGFVEIAERTKGYGRLLDSVARTRGQYDSEVTHSGNGIKTSKATALRPIWQFAIDTLKKPHTHRKYDAVLTRFAKVFDRRTLDSISAEELNDYVVALMKSGMSANTVLHIVVIIAQFCKRNGRPGLTRLLHLPERISPLPLEYTKEELASFFEVTTERERELFSTFLLTGFREQEVAYLFWSDINLGLRTIRVTSKTHLGFSPKRWEEREIPIPVDLARLLEARPHLHSERFVFPSPTGNRETQYAAQVQSDRGTRWTRLREVRPEDISFDLRHAHAQIGLRCAHGSALDGAQIVGDDNEVSGTRERCSLPARSGCRAQCR